MMASDLPIRGVGLAPAPPRPAATGSGSGDSDPMAPAALAAAAAAGSPEAKPVPCTTERCRLCGLLRLVFDIGMFKHYCAPLHRSCCNLPTGRYLLHLTKRGTSSPVKPPLTLTRTRTRAGHPCSCIRQRGYKRGLTLRDLRVAMRVHGPTHGVNDFLDLAVDTKAAQTALGRGGPVGDADAAADDAERSPPSGSKRKRPENVDAGVGPGAAEGQALSDAQETALQERMTAELLAAGLRSQVRRSKRVC